MTLEQVHISQTGGVNHHTLAFHLVQDGMSRALEKVAQESKAAHELHKPVGDEVNTLNEEMPRTHSRVECLNIEQVTQHITRDVN
ncbi:hypothetical protein ES703_65494 [subsurface metagenome]